MAIITCQVCKLQKEARAGAKYCSPKCRSAYNNGDVLKANDSMSDDQKAKAERIERMNARLRSKGLLLIGEQENVEFVKTGLAGIDDVIGGFPRKKITEIMGPKASGKSSLTKLIADAYPEYKILFFDAEGGFSNPPKNIEVIKGNVVEDVMPTLIAAAESQEYDLIVLDSVASLITRKHFDDDPMGLADMARVFGPQVKRLVALLQPLKDGLPDPCLGTAVLFINQFRDTTQSFGKKEYTVGGRALEYYSSLRLVFRSNKSDYVTKNKMVIGQKVKITIEKNRFGVPAEETNFVLPYATLKSFDDYYEEQMKELGIR